MRQQAFLLFFLILVIAALVGLNAISYTKVEQIPDTEFEPNRSSYNSGTTGTSAFYALLSETGNRVVRWQQAPSALTAPANSKIRTLVLVGPTRRQMTDDDAAAILNWVRRGNRLVLIDRYPEASLLKINEHWEVSTARGEGHAFSIDDITSSSLTDNIAAAKPVQPTALISGINAVQPSKLASSIKIKYVVDPPKKDSAYQLGYYDPPPVARPSPTPAVSNNYSSPAPRSNKDGVSIKEPDAPDEDSAEEDSGITAVAPVVHLSNIENDILADVPHGAGEVILLSDPYIVSNAGIKLVDNATLAVNMVAVTGGTIAFDEYFQGYGSENTIFRYFAGTPFLAILGQAAALMLFVLWTQGRRFARAIPLPAKDRRSKLEYVSAMADLQQSTRSYDLVIENVYLNTKRNLTRLAGADNTISRKHLADTIGERTGIDPKSLYILMSKCEDIIAGEPTNARETMQLTSQLRELEEKLGFHRSRKQSIR